MYSQRNIIISQEFLTQDNQLQTLTNTNTKHNFTQFNIYKHINFLGLTMPLFLCFLRLFIPFRTIHCVMFHEKVCLVIPHSSEFWFIFILSKYFYLILFIFYILFYIFIFYYYCYIDYHYFSFYFLLYYLSFYLLLLFFEFYFLKVSICSKKFKINFLLSKCFTT